MIDRLILGRSHPIATLGSSIGSFRHACFAQADPHAALARFTEGYVGQAYSSRPTMEDISTESDRILSHFLGRSGSREIVDNKLVHSHIVAARLRNDRGFDRGIPFRLQLATAAGRNLISREHLQKSFSRVLFQPVEPLIEFADFETLGATLSSDNVQHALLASGSIPMVMEGVRSMPEVAETLFDGGIIDYHFDFTFQRRQSQERPAGLVLFPHFFDRITPGWFDKPLRWRKPSAAAIADVVMIAPSDSFVKRLPGGKVPDRNDFLEMETEERFRRWRQVMDECEVLANELNDLFDGKSASDQIQPFPA